MANLGLQNKNPGNLKDPSTGQFRVFNSPEEGHQALLNDIRLKQSGKSSHIKPGASIGQLASVWAPASDNNVPANWAKNVSTHLGVDVNTPFDSIPAERLAEGIQVAEGTSSPTSPDHSSVGHSPLAQKIRAKYPTEYNDLSDTELENKVLTRYPQYADLATGKASTDGYVRKPEIVKPSEPNQTGTPEKPGFIQGAVQSIAHPFLEAGASIGSIGNHLIAAGDYAVGRNEQGKARSDMANKIDTEGSDYGYLGKARPLGADFDIGNPMSKNVKPLLSAGASGAEIGSDIAFAQGLGGLTSKLFKGIRGGSALATPAAQSAIERYIPEEIGSKSLSQLMNPGVLSSAEKLNALTEGLKGATTADRLVLEKAIEEVAPLAMRELGLTTFAEKFPFLAKSGGMLAHLLKYGAIATGGGIVAAGLGGKAQSLYNKIIR